MVHEVKSTWCRLEGFSPLFFAQGGARCCWNLVWLQSSCAALEVSRCHCEKEIKALLIYSAPLRYQDDEARVFVKCASAPLIIDDRDDWEQWVKVKNQKTRWGSGEITTPVTKALPWFLLTGLLSIQKEGPWQQPGCKWVKEVLVAPCLIVIIWADPLSWAGCPWTGDSVDVSEQMPRGWSKEGVTGEDLALLVQTRLIFPFPLEKEEEE